MLKKENHRVEISKWQSEKILARFKAEGVPSAPLLDRMELLSNEQIVANQSVPKLNYEEFGEVRQARPAANLKKLQVKYQDQLQS